MCECVREGEPYQVSISRKGSYFSLNKYGEIELVGEAFDFGRFDDGSSAGGHTLPPISPISICEETHRERKKRCPKKLIPTFSSTIENY